MPRRAVVVSVAIALLAAGCLGGQEDPVANASVDGFGDANASADGDQSRQDSSGNSTDDSSEDNDTRSGGGQSSDTNDTSETSGDEGEGSGDGQASQYPPWPDPANASIRPGVQVIAAGQCTSNFLFRTPDNATLMLGVASHCFDEGTTNTGSNGCSENLDPMEPGTEVEIEGASQPGTLVYSSFWTLAQMDDPSREVCLDNDFALVAIDPGDRSSVHPAVMEIGGPTGLAAGGDVGVGDEVRWFGNTGLTPSTSATNRHEGTIVSSTDWSFQAYSITPGLPGDSGSGIMLDDGRAAGVLVTVNAFYPGANGVTKLDPALSFAEEHTDLEAQLVTWRTLGTGPFD